MHNGLLQDFKMFCLHVLFRNTKQSTQQLHLKQLFSHLSETCWKLSKQNAGALKKHNAATVTSREMNASLRWIEVSSLVQILNVKWPSWPLWAQQFTILAHAKECTVEICRRATWFMMCFITGHTSVSRILTYKTDICIIKCSYWKLLQVFSVYFSDILEKQLWPVKTS